MVGAALHRVHDVDMLLVANRRKMNTWQLGGSDPKHQLKTLLAGKGNTPSLISCPMARLRAPAMGPLQ